MAPGSQSGSDGRTRRPPRFSIRPETVRPHLVTRQQVFLAAKAALAAGVAWELALAAHPSSRPYFAPIAVLLVVQPTIYDSFSRAFQRVAGVVLGVAIAVAVEHFVAPNAWSIGIVILVGLLVAWTTPLGPQGAVQVPVSALLVLLVGRATPGYGGQRIVDTLIGAGVAVIAVVLSPSAPTREAVLSDVLAPLRHCRDILRAISAGLASRWTPAQAASWRQDALGLVDAMAKARQDHQAHELNARWNARAHRRRPALARAEAGLDVAERVAAQTRSIARAVMDGSADARPLPGLSAMLARTASAVEAYSAWVTSADTTTDQERLADAIQVAEDTIGATLARVQERWGSDATQWLTFGTILAMSQRILAEVERPLSSGEGEPHGDG